MKKDSEEIARKREKESEVMKAMVHIYCRGKHGSKKGELCEDCQALVEYANKRVENCPFMEKKTFCSNCKVHCYKPDMRQKVKDVMKYAGPRMLLVKPGLVIAHIYYGRKNRRK